MNEARILNEFLVDIQYLPACFAIAKQFCRFAKSGNSKAHGLKNVGMVGKIVCQGYVLCDFSGKVNTAFLEKIARVCKRFANWIHGGMNATIGR